MKFGWRQSIVAALLVGGLLTGATNARAADKNIVETAAGAGQFKTLTAALDAAGLTGTLEGPGPFTVFAPDDAAFAKLPNDTLASLLKPENKAQLVAILTYHVVPGRMLAANVLKANELKTVNGKPLAVSMKGGDAMVGNAKIIATDVAASNGVIHVIDTVVLPPAP